MIESSVVAGWVTSCRLPAVTRIDGGAPRSSTRSIRLLPFFPPIRRVGPDRFLSKRCLDHGPVDALPSPSDALHLVILGQTRLPESHEHPSLCPFEKAFVDRAGTTETLRRQCLPLAARAQNVHDRRESQTRILALATRSRRPRVLLLLVPSRCWRQQRLNPRPELIGDFPCRHTCLSLRPVTCLQP